MKYIKLFENINIEEKLAEQFDDKDVERYFDENYDLTAFDIINKHGTSVIWDYFDKETFLENYINDVINRHGIYDYDEDDYKDYIKSNIDDNKEEEIIRIYKENNYIDEDEDVEFEYSMIDDLNSNEAREVIENCREDDVFVEQQIKFDVENQDYKDIVENLYGDLSWESINILLEYINGEFEKDYIQNLDINTKHIFLRDNIVIDSELQETLLNLNRSNVFLLAKLFEQIKGKRVDKDNISCKYKFQKIYIEEYVKQNKESTSKAFALKYLNDLCDYGLNDKIKSEYEDDMWMISSDPYNL